MRHIRDKLVLDRAARKPRTKDLILHRVKEVCKSHGGCAEIGEGFVVVNTKYFTIKAK